LDSQLYCAVAIAFDSFSGTVSPFDTGGLVQYTTPLQQWSDEEKTAYLRQYSWESNNRVSLAILDLLDAYPGQSPEDVRAYLAGNRPRVEGPHKVWAPTADSTKQANIWVENDAPRAWVWEGRMPHRFPDGFRLLGWSCPEHVRVQIRAQYEHAATRESFEEYKFLKDHFVEHGVTGLMCHIRNQLGTT
jgi:hypothetical protein